jgi:fructokinase
MRDLRLGVDLGGTKIEAVVLRLPADDPRKRDAAPEILARVRRPTERQRGYEHVLEGVVAAIDDVTRSAGLAEPPAIGIGMPGGITMRAPDGRRLEAALVKNSNTTCLNGRPFRADLAMRLGRPIVFDNDANCFALAEATFGAAQGARVAFGVILGTGVGGGIAIALEGPPRTWPGAQGIAGEWGHVPLEPRTGPACYCGRRGCVETYLSGPAIERAYEERCGVRRPLAEIASRTEDAVASELLGEVVEIFGRALSIVVDVVDPDVIVLGGGVSNLDLFYDRGHAAVGRWIFDDALDTPIVRHALGDSAGVFGAALLPGGPVPTTPASVDRAG